MYVYRVFCFKVSLPCCPRQRRQSCYSSFSLSSVTLISSNGMVFFDQYIPRLSKYLLLRHSLALFLSILPLITMFPKPYFFLIPGSVKFTVSTDRATQQNVSYTIVFKSVPCTLHVTSVGHFTHSYQLNVINLLILFLTRTLTLI